MTPGTTIALAVLCWTLGSFVLGLLIARAIPRSPEPDEHEACDLDAELDGRVEAQVGAVNDFHAGSNLTTRERNHV